MMGRWVLLELKHHVCLGGRGTLQQAGGILARKVSVTHLLSQQEGTPAHLPGQRGGGTYLVPCVLTEPGVRAPCWRSWRPVFSGDWVRLATSQGGRM